MISSQIYLCRCKDEKMYQFYWEGIKIIDCQAVHSNTPTTDKVKCNCRYDDRELSKKYTAKQLNITKV